MSGWPTIPLGELCNIALGATPPRGSPRFWDTEKTTGNVWLSIADMPSTFNAVVSDSKEYLSDEGAARGRVVKRGTLLVSFKLTLGRLAFAGCDLRTNEAIAALTIRDHTLIDNAYLYWFLTHFDWDKAAEGDEKVKGKTLNKEKLKVLPIIVPPLEEQRRIVAVLDEAFAAIAQATANAEKNLANARELFDRLLSDAFHKPALKLQNGRMDDRSLLQIIDGDRGSNYPKTTDFFEQEHCLFLSTKNVRPDGFKFDETIFITEKKDAELRKGKLQRHDVVMTTRGTIGNIGYYSDGVRFDHIRINSGMLIFRANPEKIAPSFLFELLRSPVFLDQVRSRTSGAAQPQLPIATIKTFTFPLPVNLTDQYAIVSAINEMSAHTKSLEAVYVAKLTALAALKQSLLHRAFTGELTAKPELALA